MNNLQKVCPAKNHPLCLPVSRLAIGAAGGGAAAGVGRRLRLRRRRQQRLRRGGAGGAGLSVCLLQDAASTHQRQ